MKGRFNPKIDIIRALFSQIRAPFSIIKKGKGRLPLLSSPSCAPLSVTEYASISLNIPKYPWKCLNKLSWLCQCSEYGWSSDMFNILLKMPQVLNVPRFWIWHGYICKGYTEFWICLNIAQYTSIMPEYDSICCNVRQNTRRRLNIAECSWTSLKILG